jgi:hypothetical protein
MFLSEPEDIKPNVRQRVGDYFEYLNSQMKPLDGVKS